MWVLTTDGFFSAVQSADPDVLTVRARVLADATDLAERFSLPVQQTPGRDYLYRVMVPRARWADYVAEAARAVDYGNFKHAVEERQGRERARIYLDVWFDLLALQGEPEGEF